MFLEDISTLIGAKKFHKQGYTGKGITIAILDTGVYPHKQLIKPNNKIVAFKDFVNYYNQPYDDNGHGTFITNIIAGSGEASKKHIGIAPESKIVSVKVLDQFGEAPPQRIIQGIEWVIQNRDNYNIKIMNISFNIILGKQSPYKEKLKGLISKAKKLGIIVVTSVGNKNSQFGSKEESYPAFFPDVITVGALEFIGDNKNDVKNIHDYIMAPYSVIKRTHNGYLKPDILTVGTNIVSAEADTSYRPGKKQNDNDSFRVDSGTSLSCAVVSGVAALLIEKYSSKYSIKEIENLLLHSTISIVNKGIVLKVLYIR
ncbi:S8 family serine peptidase [Geobacillus sp. FSL W8-0032]|uniref:Serine protease AprX n=1 Tax=Geobacillus icigianus TaxID=1430331 RepID=A0ABU6BL68_9BACL|nr:S8 family serine peptidase [Geobacillus icigianus]MEB3752617.1 Serine protease AprX [Geobacillus icigianus]